MYVSACRKSLTKRDLVLQVGGLRWVNSPLVKKNHVTETQTDNIQNHVLGDDGDSSSEETMTHTSQSREDAVEPTSPPSPKVLRIGSWNVRTMYEVGKRAQVLAEMQKNKLHILGIRHQ